MYVCVLLFTRLPIFNFQEKIALGVLSPGPCTHKVNTFFREFFEDVGVEAAIAVKLNQYLKDTGFTEINKMSRAVPLGEWADTDGNSADIFT